MKRRPTGPGSFLQRLWESFSSDELRRSMHHTVDRALVKAGWLPEMMDGSYKILHLSDTPVTIYGYLARLLRRVSPSVLVHTGDLADDIKIGLYPGERERYRSAVRKLFDIIQAPRRRIILSLGNHDRMDLLPPIPRECTICEDVMDFDLWGAGFRISHYIERIMDGPAARFNLYGHTTEPGSHVDDKERYFLNGIERIRLIDPHTGEIKSLLYPRCTDNARCMKTMRRL